PRVPRREDDAMRRSGTVCILLGLCAWMSQISPADQGKEPAKKPTLKFTVSKETTSVTEPLDKDGYIDYATALNKQLSKRITPKTNANVLIWLAFGPKPEDRAVPSEFFEQLGIKPPPERG